MCEGIQQRDLYLGNLLSNRRNCCKGTRASSSWSYNHSEPAAFFQFAVNEVLRCQHLWGLHGMIRNGDAANPQAPSRRGPSLGRPAEVAERST
jgi:hypothetical protein